MTINAAQKSFLIVDDDSDDSNLFKEALVSVGPGTKCYRAEDGTEAIEQLKRHVIDPPDLIFLDLNMPGMNGWDCLRELKAMEGFKDIPVIIHTTSTSSADRKLALENGAICFFTKPDDFKTLKQMLTIVLEKLNSNAVDAICDAVYKYLRLN